MEIANTPSPSESRLPLAPLNTLPLHTFEHICSYIPRTSLYPLSLASRFCNEATTQQRFSRIQFTIRSKFNLSEDLKVWRTVLSRGDRFRHVRRLVLVGHMMNRSSDDCDDGDSDSDSGSDYSDIESEKTEDCSELDSESENESGSDSDRDIAVKSLRFFPSRPHATPEHKTIQHDAWLPLAEFLGQLTDLKDLVYACTTQLPKCILEALHQHQPKCRLHVRTFSLRSLYEERDQPHDVDTDELALVKSPCLYSIC